MLAFPVLWYSNRFISSPEKKGSFSRSIESFVDSGKFTGRVIDSAGVKYKIKSVTKTGLAFAPINNLFSDDKIVKIDVKLEKVTVLSREDVIREIFTHLDAHSRWVRKDVKEDMKEYYARCKTIKEVFEFSLASGPG